MDIDLLLINPPFHRRKGSGKIYPLGLGYIASVAEASGFRVHILDCSLSFDSLTKESLKGFVSWFTGEIKDKSPRLMVGIGPCTTSSIKALFLMGKICKDCLNNVPLVYGGPLVSMYDFKDLFFNNFYASAVVSGDGEYVIRDALMVLEKGGDLRTVSGFSFKDTVLFTNVIENIEMIPFPKRPDIGNYTLSVRRDLFKNPFATVMASRGCPNKCSFCVSSMLRKGRYNRRSYDNIFIEIEQLIKDYNIRTIVFYDDLLFYNSDTASKDITEFCEKFKALKSPVFWEIEMRPDVSLSLNIKHYAKMYDSGCRLINFGIETSNNETARAYMKYFDAEKFKNQLKLLRQEIPGMRTSGTFILGGERETIETAMTTIEYSLLLSLTFAHYYPLEVYPGTRMFTAYNRGFAGWLEKVLSDDMPWGEVVYESDKLKKENLLKLIQTAYIKFYKREEWQQHASEIFGDRYPGILSHVEDWIRDRFCLENT